MKLSTDQQEFCHDIAKLIIWANSIGDRLTFGEAWRPQFVCEYYADHGKGISNSLHMERLAVDLNLFVNGVYQPNTEAYRHLGAYWKTLNPKNCWGGDFSKPDGNHFSRGYAGRK